MEIPVKTERTCEPNRTCESEDYIKFMFDSFKNEENTTKTINESINNLKKSEFVNQFINQINSLKTAINDINEQIINEHVNERENQDINQNSVDIENLVKEKQIINMKIANLNEEEQKEFWSQYHNIPSYSEINKKLDFILRNINVLSENINSLSEKITVLDTNFNNFSDEVYTELTLLRKK